MKIIELNGKRLTKEGSAQDYIFDMFDFPEYYGDDLEALYDALADIVEETYVKITNREAMNDTEFGSKLMWIFEDAASDNDRLYLSWTEDQDYDFD